MPLAVVTTNLVKENIPRDFMAKLSTFLKTTFQCNDALTMVELRPGALLMRAGSTDATVNVEIHHSHDKLTCANRKEFGKTIADFLIEQLHVDITRILVLFFDTRCTSKEGTTTDIQTTTL